MERTVMNEKPLICLVECRFRYYTTSGNDSNINPLNATNEISRPGTSTISDVNIYGI
jgi:hypothetical protein